MAGEQFFGTTLTDVQAAKTAQSRMAAERQLQAERLFAQTIQARAERDAAARRADQDRAAQMFGFARQDRNDAAARAIQGEQFRIQQDNERIKQEAEKARIAAILESERIRGANTAKVAEIEARSRVIDPRIAIESMKEESRIAESNALADQAAAQANTLLGNALREAAQASNTVAQGSGLIGAPYLDWSTRNNNLAENRGVSQAYRDVLQKKIVEIPTALGDLGALISFDPQQRRFVAQKRAPATRAATMFPGVGSPTAPAAVTVAEDTFIPGVGYVGEAATTPVNRVFPGQPSAPATVSDFIYVPGVGLRPRR